MYFNVRKDVGLCILETPFTRLTFFFTPFMERVYFHFEGFVVIVVVTISYVDPVFGAAKVLVVVAVAVIITLSCY